MSVIERVRIVFLSLQGIKCFFKEQSYHWFDVDFENFDGDWFDYCSV